MRIVFVDDEQNVLQGLRRSLRSIRREHEMVFLDSGQAVLDFLDEDPRPFHLIVSDMRMPGLDGATLLNEVRDRYPNMFRIILSGGSEQEVTFKTTHIAHQYLTKPCDADILKNTISALETLKSMVSTGPLQKLLSHMSTIPSMPRVYEELLRELRSDEPTMKKVGQIIARDVGMTTKILQLVNSAFFGVAHRINMPEQAATMLGLETIKALVLSVGIFIQFEPDLFPEFSFDKLWQHGARVGACAKKIAGVEEKKTAIIDASMMAGLLHDSGKLVLAANLPVHYREALQKSAEFGLPLHVCEREIIGATHAEAGAYVLGLWGLPKEIIEALAHHHDPSKSESSEFTPLTAVHAANAITNEFTAENGGMNDTIVDEKYLGALGLASRISLWKENCAKVLEKENI